ncbi:DUF5067 domain-containing protein [Enterococcus sp. AZ192]|uniref:DUF5067 domain-containing protein n=1 Tax=unclassified Enterococcus TaxID=2608891 RepID=UPI003D29AD93
MKNKKVLGLLLVLVLLTGCQSFSLQKKTDDFSFNGSEYSIRLPKNWEVEEKPEDQLNKTAIFGAVDRKSNSTLFVRADKKNLSNQVELEKEAVSYLKKFYEVKKSDKELIEVQGKPAVRYTFVVDYQEKDSWLDIYFVATERGVLQLNCYSQMDNSSDKRRSSLKESIETLTEKVDEIQETQESTTENKLANKVENEQLAITVSKYNIEKIENQNYMVLRYVYKNKSAKELIPSEHWKKYMVVSQGDQQLRNIDEIPMSDESLEYLVGAGNRNLAKGSSVEGALIYPLSDTEKTIQIVFDSTEFPNKEPLSIQLTE